MISYRSGLTAALLVLARFAASTSTAAEADPNEIAFHAGTVLRFAKASEGYALLKQDDRYLNAQSPLDRQIRMQTDASVSKNTFAEFSAEQAQAWLAPQREAITQATAALASRLKDWRLPWPAVITLVHTTGREESNSAYCRGATIALSTQRLLRAQTRDQLEHLLAHELFHVLSSHNPDLRKALYEIIGFKVCNEITLPPELAARKITNPDAPTIDCYLEARRPDATWYLAPLLMSKRDRFDPRQSTELFDYINFQLLEVEQLDGKWRPLLRAGSPVLHKPSDVPEFAQQIGGNTGYIIHPDEILAENFALLVAGKRNVPTPRILEAMAKLLGPAPTESH